MWPLDVRLNLLGDSRTEAFVSIRAGMNTLVGPNGSGKTRALRGIRSALQHTGKIDVLGRKIHFLAAGRSSPLARSDGSVDYDMDTAVGHRNDRERWWELESVTGALLSLDARADLRFKIEARLQQLFDRSVQLSWSQFGLNVRMLSVGGGPSYAANAEASGIIQLVALLAAIHNDEIGALLIDEPEISLHPQHQAFLLEEMEGVAGDPAEPNRKIIVIATHAAAFLPLRSVNELPALTFFNSVRSAPVQIPADAEILRREELTALVARLGATHRVAMFAERVLLVEGPSDEIIATQLARRLDLRLLARNAQILPVTGKGKFVEAAKLFRLMKKEVSILADLDALTDDNTLVNLFSELPAASSIADRLGRQSIAALDRELRAELVKFMRDHCAAAQSTAAQDADCSAKKWVTLARILTNPASFDEDASSCVKSLRTRYLLLINALKELGCFFLCRGVIENYYTTEAQGGGKPNLAAQEAATFETTDPVSLRKRYEDMVAALVHIAPNQHIDEDLLLRAKLGAILTSVFLEMEKDSSDERLNAIAAATVAGGAEIFRLSNCSKSDLRIGVEIVSSLFQRNTFPFEIGREENPIKVVMDKLPGRGS